MIETKSIKDKFNNKWWDKLSSHFELPYMQQIYSRIASDVRRGFKVLPSSNDIYQRFKLINPDDVRVVFITNEPICNYNQSLEWRNILSWVEKECFDGFKLVTEENMDYLIPQGVINLSPSLTVCNKSNHSGIGWGEFYTAVLKILKKSDNKILYCFKGASLLKLDNHIELEEGCFKKINEFMQVNYNTKISW